MKVLWLTETPSRYKSEEIGYNGRGWIASLQSLLENCKEIDSLGVVFPHATDTERHTAHKSTYYPIRRVVPGNILSWILSNWKNKVEHKEEINQLKAIVEEFDPDLIHIFGTESWLCKVVEMTDKPCIVHLQGLMLPCLNAFIPMGISKFDLMRHNWIGFIKGISLWHFQRTFEKKAKREYQFFKQVSFFMGRTFWDRSISSFLSPRSTYFHVNEVLRDNFYTAFPWRYHKTDKLILTSTLSDSLYKGLDLVIKTAALLVKEGYEFEWRVIGVKSNSKSARLLQKKFPTGYPSPTICLLGIKNTDEIIDLLSETTLYIHTSHIDNSPNSLCEAQLMGVPIIATNVGGVSSLIENGKDGFLVPANDPYFMASQIARVGRNHQLLKRISIQAREKAQKRHSKENIINQLIYIYKTLTFSPSKKSSSGEKVLSYVH